MDIHQAAEELREHFGRPPWLVSVGVGRVDGREAIIVYLASSRHPDLSFLEGGWKGFPVVAKQFGSIAPLKM